MSKIETHKINPKNKIQTRSETHKINPNRMGENTHFQILIPHHFHERLAISDDCPPAERP